MFRIADYGWMLRDRARIEAYRRALASVITPESIVLDLGTGIGTFSLLAARLGAARVYAVDPSETISVAEEHARANGFADRIRFIRARAADLELPEQVDVIVSDLASALPLFEESLPSIISARDRFLRAGGALHRSAALRRGVRLASLGGHDPARGGVRVLAARAACAGLVFASIIAS